MLVVIDGYNVWTKPKYVFRLFQQTDLKCNLQILEVTLFFVIPFIFFVPSI